MDLDIPIENWVTSVLEHRGWNTRAPQLLEIIGSNLDNSATWDLPQEIHALALSQMLTASLEHLTEKEIDCIEAAAMYALTLHYDEWAEGAVQWLQSIRKTWFPHWKAKHPNYARFAKLMRTINPALPAWIAE
jgi:hypothetical protein